MYKIIFFDIDGTLYQNNKVEESAIYSLRKLKEKGYLICIASGRNYKLIKDYTPLIDLFDFDYFVLSNGACVLDNKLNVIIDHPIKEDILEKMIKISNKINSNIIFSTKDDFFSLNNNFEITIPDFTVFSLKAPEVKERLISDKVYMLDLFCTDRDFNKFEEETKDDIRYIKLIKYGYDCLVKDVTKAKGILELLDYLKIDIKDSIAFGDQINDIEMLQAVGYSVCMGNGHEEVKKIASLVTDRIDKDGIYKALIKLGLID